MKEYVVGPEEDQEERDDSTTNDDEPVVIQDDWDNAPANEQNPSDSDDD